MSDVPPPRSPRDHSDDFTERLSAGLHQGYDRRPVDVAALRDGARATSRRMRRRRNVGVALVVAATVAVPAGVVTALSQGRRPQDVQVASGVEDATTSPSPTASHAPSPTPTDVTSPSPTTNSPSSTPSATSPSTTRTAPPVSTAPAADDVPIFRRTDEPRPVRTPRPRIATFDPGDPNSVAYAIPDEVALPDDVFPVALEDGYDSGQYRYHPTVPGQACNENREGDRPIAGRQWMRYNTRAGYSFTQIVTGWERGTGRDRFADLRDDTGQCRFMETQAVLTLSDDTWIATEQRGKLSFARGAVLVGDVIVSLEVQSPRGTAHANELLRELLPQAVERLAYVR